MDMSIHTFEVLFLLLAGHALADFGLQTEFVARFKNHHEKMAGTVSKRPDLIWIHILMAHSIIHGLAVFLILGNLWLGIAETLCHAATDFMKSNNRFGFHTDQFIHIACKFLWWALWIVFIS